MQAPVRLLAALALCGSLIGGGATALAQDATPAASTPGAVQLFPGSCAVVAQGLNDPRYVAIGDDGSIYVAEAGNGGTEAFVPVATPVPGATPAPAASPVADEEVTTRGTSGQITRIAPDGTQSVLVSGLPSYGGVGPVGIVFLDGGLYVSIGGGAAGTAYFTGTEIDPLEFENSIIRIDLATNDVTLVAEIGSYEVNNNPDGTDINPNLYGLTLGPDGLLYVADAGGNAIYRVKPKDGSYQLVAFVPSMQELMGESRPESLDELRQPVPLKVAFDSEGRMYVTLLSEGWEAASLLRLEDDGTWTSLGTPGQFMFDLEVAPDGTMYQTQGTTDFGDGSSAPAPGFVASVDIESGGLTPVVEGLFVPFGTAFDGDGNVFVTVNSIAFGPGDPAGMLVKCPV